MSACGLIRTPSYTLREAIIKDDVRSLTAVCGENEAGRKTY